jgi:hypothetical protein
MGGNARDPNGRAEEDVRVGKAIEFMASDKINFAELGGMLSTATGLSKPLATS